MDYFGQRKQGKIGQPNGYPIFYAFILLFSQYKMSFHQQIYKVNNSDNPAPTEYYEHNKHKDMFHFLRSQHNGESD